MATFIAHIKVLPGYEAAFEAMERGLYEGTHAGEPRMRRYECWRGQEERTYYVLESFDAYEGFLEHQVSGHHDTLTADFRNWIESFWIEWLDPVQGASPLVTTVDAGAPPGASEQMRSYAERMPVEIAPWWLPLR